jgi:hypothetical protein
MTSNTQLHDSLYFWIGGRVMVFNATFNNISGKTNSGGVKLIVWTQTFLDKEWFYVSNSGCKSTYKRGIQPRCKTTNAKWIVQGDLNVQDIPTSWIVYQVIFWWSRLSDIHTRSILACKLTYIIHQVSVTFT